ncbi:S1 RNA-binding domain-containing protein [Streptococcus pneumoniae]|nr:S1 RNA-binding domain-containing protein [Streptococcus pneumoniae]
MCFTHSFFHFATLRKSLQTTSALSASSKISSNHVIVALPYVWLLTLSVLSTTSKQYFELTSSVLSATSKQCFEQPAASFLVCSLIFIEY